MNDAAFRRLRDGSFLDGGLAELRRTLASPPRLTVGPKTGPFDPSFLAVITTRGCNINCVYCDFGGPTSDRTRMPAETAVAAVDSMANILAERGRKEFMIHFFGGEPFTAQDVVETVVHRARMVSARLGLQPRFDASTNGVLTRDQVRFISDYFDSLVFSFDGPKQFHDRNRPAAKGRGTFDAVYPVAKELSRAPLEFCLRVCITEESVAQMPAIAQWMVEEFTPAIINFEPLTENDLTDLASLRPPDPYAFARGWVASQRIAAKSGVRVVYSATEGAIPRMTSCPVGTDAMIVSLDGAVNACYLQPADWIKRGMDMRMGAVSLKGGIEIDPESLVRIRELIADKPRCRSCYCRFSCAGGCHVINTPPGSPDHYIPFCVQTRIITACTILNELGFDDLVDELLADQSALERLANHAWDPIVIQEAASA